MSDRDRTYLILADGSEEFMAAAHYAALAAKKVGAGIVVLHVMEEPDFQHWGGIEERMRQEQHEQAQRFLLEVQQEIFDLSGIRPQVVIEEGKKAEQVVKAIENYPSINKLILAASTNPSGPGPLIEYFAGKGMDELRITLTIVPGHLSAESIAKLL